MPISKNGYSNENLRRSRGGEAGLISRMGAYEESRRKLREERNREYNEFLAKVQQLQLQQVLKIALQRSHWLQWDAPNSPPKLPLALRRSPPNLIHPSLDRTRSPP